MISTDSLQREGPGFKHRPFQVVSARLCPCLCGLLWNAPVSPTMKDILVRNTHVSAPDQGTGRKNWIWSLGAARGCSLLCRGLAN